MLSLILAFKKLAIGGGWLGWGGGGDGWFWLNIRNGLVEPFNTEAVYCWESGYLTYFRGSFHADGLTRKVPSNILFDHQREHHPGK